MKVKTTYKLTGLCLIASVAALSLGSCNYTEDYKKDDDSAVMNDSAAVSKVDNTRDNNDRKDTVAQVMPIESSSASVATASTTPAVKSESMPAKSGGMAASSVKHTAAKKYRTNIVMPAAESTSEMVKDKDGVYNMAQVMPQFPGGHRALENYINNHLNYPDQAIDDNACGIVKVSFVVDENGKITDARLVSREKVGDGLEQEAIRAVSAMPAWKPGKIHGKNVKTRLELPINFQLDV